MKLQSPDQSHPETKSGFTFLELLVVIGIIVFCGLLILPAMARPKGDSSVVRCLNNLRQLTAAWKMYADDNSGSLVWSYPGVGCPGAANAWVSGTAHSSGTTGSYCYAGADPITITAGKLWPYVKAMEAYKCPTDKRIAPIGAPMAGQPLLRSYSMNSWMAGRSYGDPSGGTFNIESGGTSPDALTYQVFLKDWQIRKPSQTFVFIDENLSTIDDGMFLVDMGIGNGLINVPGNQHNASYSLTFADGRSELYKLKDPSVQKATVTLTGYKGIDYITLTNVTTHRR